VVASCAVLFVSDSSAIVLLGSTVAMVLIVPVVAGAVTRTATVA
jgi:hypothetical protein